VTYKFKDTDPNLLGANSRILLEQESPQLKPNNAQEGSSSISSAKELSMRHLTMHRKAIVDTCLYGNNAKQLTGGL
jgi:hypothetical protein